MVSNKFDFSEFIDSIKDKDKHIIISSAETEAKEAEKRSEMSKNGHEYVNALIDFIYFLRYSQISNEIKEDYIKLFHIVCEKLVAKKQLSSDLLILLKPKEKYTRCIGII